MASWVILLLTVFGALLGRDACAAHYDDFGERDDWASNSAPDSHEPYSVRPDIAMLRAKSHSSELPPGWNQMRYALLELAAQTLEMYPDREVYFLGRDLEWGYDTWRKLGLPRGHLLNVSQYTKESPDLEKYLGSRGLDHHTVFSGKKVVFLDTGYYGSILTALKDVFASAAPNQIVSQLMVSGNSDIPSSRSALFYMDPRSADTKPSLLHASVREFEALPHYTEKAEFYQNHRGIWEPMSSIYSDAPKSQRYIEDLSYFLEDPKTRAYFVSRRRFWHELKALELSSDRDVTIAKLKELLAEAQHPAQMRAAIRDFLEIVRLNSDAHFRLPLGPEDVGLPRELTHLSAPLECVLPAVLNALKALERL